MAIAANALFLVFLAALELAPRRSELEVLRDRGKVVERRGGGVGIVSTAGAGIVRFPIDLKYKPMSEWQEEELSWTNL